VIDWGKAFEVFMVGFGGVFACLVMLQCTIIVFSKIAGGIEKVSSKGKE